MSMLEALLEERQKILKELESVENVLSTRYGWKPDAKPKALVTVGAILNPAKFYGGGAAVAVNSAQEDSPDQIQYSEEFRNWLKERKEPFAIGDFREFLEKKFGAVRVNDNSIRTPFRTAESSGDIIVIRKGAGRLPSMYAPRGFAGYVRPMLSQAQIGEDDDV